MISKLLKKQLQIGEYRNDAEECIKVMNSIKEFYSGAIWSTAWDCLTVCTFIGNHPNSIRIHKLSAI